MLKYLAKGFAVITAAILVSGTPLPCSATTPAVHKAPAKTQPFYLKDGDRVVFYGDSITDQRLYTTYIESYCVTRFPKRHFTFIHSGWGGDRVTGGGGGPIDVRLRRDVLPYKPTVVTICLGMNDGSYRAYDQGIFDTYLNGYRHILDTLIKELPGVRITLLTASAYDDVTQAPNFEGGYNSTLRKYGAAVENLAKEYKLTLADTNAPLVAALIKAREANPDLASKVIPDRVHPGPGGHMIMAAAVLKAWNAPSEVADIEIDATKRHVNRQENTRIGGLKVSTQGLTFTHLDRALPWPLDRDKERNKDMQLVLEVTDNEASLNHFQLKVAGLPSGKYQMKVDGSDVAEVSAEELSAGLDLDALDKLPSNVQAHEVLDLTRKHNDLHFRRWRQVQFPVSKNGEEPPADVKSQMEDLDKQDQEAANAQHDAAQPKPHKVELTRMP